MPERRVNRYCNSSSLKACSCTITFEAYAVKDRNVQPIKLDYFPLFVEVL
jgi:hypothetical protein